MKIENPNYAEAAWKLSAVERVALDMSQATELAANAAHKTAGLGDKKISDQAAVDAMRSFLNLMGIAGRIVVGEGVKDKAPMLYIGENIGTGDGPELDIAVDPLEGTDATADLLDRASSVIAFSEREGLLYIPPEVHYMDKLVVTSKARDLVDINAPVADNIKALAKALDKDVTDLNIIVLKRPRNEKLIADIRATGAKVKGIAYGDLMPGIVTCIQGSETHAVMGIGGAPEGVLTAAGIRAFDGHFQGKIWPKDSEEANKFAEMGIDINKVMTEKDLAPGNMIGFSSTAVTNHDNLLRGTRSFKGAFRTDSFVFCSLDGISKIIKKDTTLVTNNKDFQFRLQ